MLERFGHGGDLLTAQELYGLEASRYVDFSANMNPLGPPPCVAGLLRSYADAIGRYPDPASRRLLRKLSQVHGIDERCLIPGNGAAELIELTVRLFAPSVTVIAAPSFAEYADAARKAGSRIAAMRLRRENGFALTPELARQSLEKLRAEGVRQGEALWLLGSPNNPTGRLCDPAIVRWLTAQGERVVVDEAFMDFIPEEGRFSVLRDAAADERIVVIRSMTKFYAIPGIRLGYAAAAPETIGRLKALQTPWSVNSLAQQIGEAVLEDEGFRSRTLRWLAEERGRLAEGLKAPGFEVFDGAANYLLFSIPAGSGFTASSLQRRLGAGGVLIRDASRFEELDESFCRVAVRLRRDNERLLEELEAALKSHAEERQRSGRDERKP
ncbi:threonine-phosphate decarboxylase CobD [Paenibacillus humicola]|uniref:threonine-phosphate decarboxylase CobD n=1 Tax=Paenibacillus humicola TaxID=3110540 RepID=UPI00237B1B1B|nr:threonine-phosphate decarboxylase CobD [Paenibacillus humicola]